MSDERLKAVLNLLPATAQQIRRTLGITHEEVYEILVSLDTRRLALVRSPKYSLPIDRMWVRR